MIHYCEHILRDSFYYLNLYALTSYECVAYGYLTMFSPLLKSCFPYAPYPVHYNNDDTNTVESNEIASTSNVIEASLSRSSSSDSGTGAGVGTNGGKRYSPPCEPPPPTPTLPPSSPSLSATSFKRNARGKVSEIEYAVPFIHRYENYMNSNSNGSNIRHFHEGFQVVYENVNASNDNCSVRLTQMGNITDYRGEEIVQVNWIFLLH